MKKESRRIILQEDHLFEILSPDVLEICKNLFKDTPIKCFTHGRFYDDGTCHMLTSNNGWLPHYFKKEYKLTAPIAPHLLKKKFCYITPKSNTYQQALKDSRSLFHHDHFIDLIEIHDGYYDMFSFGAVPNNEWVFNFYLNHVELLEKFTMYYREQAQPLIKKVSTSKILLSDKMRPSFNSKTNPNICQKDEAELFLNALKSTRKIFNRNRKEIYLTEREKECVQHLASGKTVKMIAHNMGNISPRTVETHLNNLKEKFKCYSKTDLVDFIWSNNLLELV